MHSIKIITYGSNRHPVILGFSEKSEMNEGEGGGLGMVEGWKRWGGVKRGGRVEGEVEVGSRGRLNGGGGRWDGGEATI